MVKFDTIALCNDKGWVMAFANLDLFDQFRKELWGNPRFHLRLLLEWAGQNSLERYAESVYNLPSRSLDGTCLIFGNRDEAAGRLTTPLTREILTDPQTRAVVKAFTHTNLVETKVYRGDTSYVFSYPLSQTLIPPEADIEEGYIKFISSRAHDRDGDFCVVLDGTLAEMMAELRMTL